MSKTIIRYKSVLPLLALVFTLVSCGNKRFYNKKIRYKDVYIHWYFESYISNNRIFINVEKDGKEENIMSLSSENVLDIYGKDDTIFIKMFTASQPAIYNQSKHVFQYEIKIDSTNNFEDYQKVYQPDRYRELQEFKKKEERDSLMKVQDSLQRKKDTI